MEECDREMAWQHALPLIWRTSPPLLFVRGTIAESVTFFIRMFKTFYVLHQGADMNTTWRRRVLLVILNAFFLECVVSTAWAGQPTEISERRHLKQLIAEYKAAVPDMRKAPSADRTAEYRRWLDRFTAALAAADSDPDTRHARIIQLSLANGCGLLDMADSVVDELAATADSPADRAMWLFEKASIAEARWSSNGPSRDAASLVASALAHARQFCLQNALLKGAVAERYVAATILEAGLYERVLDDYQKAAMLYKDAARVFAADLTEEERARFTSRGLDEEELLSRQMHAHAKAGDINAAKRLFQQIAGFSVVRQGLGRHLIVLTKAEFPTGGTQFQDRLRSWIADHPADPSIPEVWYHIGIDQARSGDGPAALESLSKAVSTGAMDDRSHGILCQDAWFQIAMISQSLGRDHLARNAAWRFAELAAEDDPRTAILANSGLLPTIPSSQRAAPSLDGRPLGGSTVNKMWLDLPGLTTRPTSRPAGQGRDMERDKSQGSSTKPS